MNVSLGVNFDPYQLSFLTEVVHLDCISRQLFVLFLPVVLTKLDFLGIV